MLRFIFKKGIERKPFFDYDYAIYFNLNRDIGREELGGRISSVKNMRVSRTATRDLSIAFCEPSFCPDDENLKTSWLEMTLEELEKASISISNEAKTYHPDHVLKLKIIRKDVELLEIRYRTTQLASDLYYKLYREQNILGDLLFHFNDGERSDIKPV